MSAKGPKLHLPESDNGVLIRRGMSRPTGRPRVLHVITRLIVGGAQFTTIRLCEHLADEYDTLLATGPQTGVEGSLHDLARATSPVRVVPSLRRELHLRHDGRAVRELRRLIEELDPAIVHTHSSKAGIIGRAATLGSRVRLVHTVHGWGHTPEDAFGRRVLLVGLERLAARRTDALIAVSQDVMTEGLRQRIGSPELYHVISEMVDLCPRQADFAASRRQARELLGISQRQPVIGWVGRFAEQKDPRTLTAALSTVLRARGDARAVLVGDGTLRASVERTLDPVIASRVTFTGVRHDARELYAAFDVLMHPTLWEGQPHVIQEALAERVPVVSAAVNGTHALVKEGMNGYLVPPADSEALAARTLEVLRGDGPHAPLGGDATAHLATFGGQARSLKSHRELYASLLNGR